MPAGGGLPSWRFASTEGDLAMKEYKVVHFVPSLEHGVLGGAKGVPVEKQVERVLNEHVSQGWVLVDYDAVHVQVRAGCLAGLFGKSDMTVE